MSFFDFKALKLSALFCSEFEVSGGEESEAFWKSLLFDGVMEDDDDVDGRMSCGLIPATVEMSSSCSLQTNCCS